jgi:FkbM family methyltransferase
MVKQAVRRAGLEGPARRMLDARNPARRRDRLDDEHLRLALAFILEERSNCVDIGGNRGEVLELMAHYAPGGHHFAFEPVPPLAARLAERFPGATIKQIALADYGGTARFSYVVDADAYSGLSDRNLASNHVIEHIDVEVARLDDVLPEDFRPDFIKIDVEGAELQVLRGAERVLSEHRPPIWFEHGHGSSGYYGATPDDVWDLLCGQHGYRIVNADGGGPLSREKFFSGTGAEMWSYFAHY